MAWPCPEPLRRLDHRCIPLILWALVACGSSPDSNALTSTNQRTGTSSDGGSGGVLESGGTGGAFPGAGGFVGAGGTPFGGASGQIGNGGVIGAGGFVFGAGGIAMDSGQPPPSGGSVGSGGTPAGVPDAGTSPNPFPPGGLISKACSDCARTMCQSQEAACTADPACVAVGKCLSTCFGPTCLGCLTTFSSQNARTEFLAVTDCTNQKCQPECPMINTGGGGTNP